MQGHMGKMLRYMQEAARVTGNCAPEHLVCFRWERKDRDGGQSRADSFDYVSRLWTVGMASAICCLVLV